MGLSGVAKILAKEEERSIRSSCEGQGSKDSIKKIRGKVSRNSEAGQNQVQVMVKENKSELRQWMKEEKMPSLIYMVRSVDFRGDHGS